VRRGRLRRGSKGLNSLRIVLYLRLVVLRHRTHIFHLVYYLLLVLAVVKYIHHCHC
jgi:hypothetical protein